MTSHNPAPDDADRERALDPGRSFLVQAPAGAGKTELLTQRFLRLLAQAEEPEEVLAVTFTRKAAAEMRRRIVTALALDTGASTASERPLDRRVATLVAAVRERDSARGWQLGLHPARLRISTIDSLNAALAQGTPVTSGSGVLRKISEQPRRFYREAAESTLLQLGEVDPVSARLATLLRHLDVEPERLITLLTNLLGSREQWLPLIGTGIAPGTLRVQLETGLANLVDRDLRALAALLSDEHRVRLAGIVASAAGNRGVMLAGDGIDDPVTASRLVWWQAAAELLLTQKDSWRVQLNVRGGFPPGQVALKTEALALLAELAAIPGLQAALVRVGKLPAPVYSDAQWAALDALVGVLPIAVAQLSLVFAIAGQTDFSQVAAEARAALGDEDSPSELALRIDWRLQHILVDEFQDTSRAQYALLTALTRGWTPGDGRTLFLVGDPMQSIYRFRQAEVRLFLGARQSGLPGVSLEFIQLRSNFRSVAPLVEWVNGTFPAVFPTQDDLLTSAVAFAPSVAARDEQLEQADDGADAPAPVSFHATAWRDHEAEAARVVAIVRDALARAPGQSIGILVRARSHATRIVAALRAAGISFGATDLVQLGQTELANDLLTLTRALLHPGDRLAWLGLLRAPWCGLTLADLETLSQGSAEQTLHERCQLVLEGGECWPGERPMLSADGEARVRRLTAAMDLAISRLGAVPLRSVVEGLWNELGGPAVAEEEAILADLVFDQLERFEVGGSCPDLDAMTRALDELPASLAAVREPVQVMTIHKAKGLQFGTVIVPGLGLSPRRDSRPILLWDEPGLTSGGEPDRIGILLAPVNARGAGDNPLYELLWRLRRIQGEAEDARLLYVAVTRARRKLHLLGQVRNQTHSHLDSESGGEAGMEACEAGEQPGPGSLLHRLWPAVADSWPRITLPATRRPEPDRDNPTRDWQQPVLKRLPAGWQRPGPMPGLAMPRPSGLIAQSLVPYDWAGAWTRKAGSVAHRWLQHIGSRGVEHFDVAAVESLMSRCRQLLARAGVAEEQLAKATDRVRAVLERAVSSGEGRWVLSGKHREAVNEYPLTAMLDDGLQRLVVDRSFIAVDGTRWIIDYKTGSHEGGDLPGFIRSESARYRAQLTAYRRAFALLDTRPTRTALYFPLLDRIESVD